MKPTTTEAAICCMIVSNPCGGMQPHGWQKRVNDLIRAQDQELATLRAERDAAQSELDDCLASDWPIWATQIYNTLKEFGYRYDHFDGIDLPEDVSEFLRGFPENAASELMEQRDDALQELATLRASEAAAMERVTELEAVACSYQAALLRQGIDGSKGPKE